MATDLDLLGIRARLVTRAHLRAKNRRTGVRALREDVEALLGEVARLTQERDRARAVAVAFEQEAERWARAFGVEGFHYWEPVTEEAEG